MKFRLCFLWTASMSSHKANTDKPHALKCRYFCFPFDSHNYCRTCREAGRGDDPCVTGQKSCRLCSSFSEEHFCKIKNRNSDWNSCNVLTADQRTQLLTPCYKLKKEKRDTDTPASTTMDTDSSSLVEPALVPLVGELDGHGTSQSPGLSGLKEKKKNVASSEEKSKQPASKPAISSDRPAKSFSDSRLAKA